MTCLTNADRTVAICDGGEKTFLRAVRHCPVCKRQRRFSAFSQPWYGATWTCLGCGDSWTDGEMHERPFRPRWRKESIAQARKDWGRGVSLAEYRRLLRSGRAA